MSPHDLWKPLDNPSQIEELMVAFGNFHDSCIREAHIATGHHVREDLAMATAGPTTVRLLVQRQFRPLTAIELRFDELVGLHLPCAPSGYTDIIYDAALFISNGIVYWANSASWAPDSSADYTWIAAKRVFWRDASEWIGESLRYRRVSD